MGKNTIIIFKNFFMTILLLYIINSVIYNEGHMLVDALNLCIHEFGHVIFRLFGDFLYTLGGTILQVGLPLSIAIYAIYKRQRYSAAILFIWAGQNMLNISTYIKDARAQVLPLFPSGALHDWNLLLGWMGLLNQDIIIGNTVYVMGWIVIIAAYAMGVFFALKNEK